MTASTSSRLRTNGQVLAQPTTPPIRRKALLALLIAASLLPTFGLHATSAGDSDESSDEFASGPAIDESRESKIDALRSRVGSEATDESADQLRIELCAARRAAGELDRPPVTPARETQAATAPVEIHAPIPTPPTILRDRMHGDQRATVSGMIDADGCVTPISVLSATSNEWGRYAYAQVRSWVFRPALRDGRPVSVFYQLKLKYRRK